MSQLRPCLRFGCDGLGHLPKLVREGERAERALLGGNRQDRDFTKLISCKAFLSQAKPFMKTRAPEAAFRSRTWPLTVKLSPSKTEFPYGVYD